MGHKRFSPSGSKKWLGSKSKPGCTGSIQLIESLDLEDSTNDAAELGTGVHEVGEICIRDDTIEPIDYLNKEMNGHVMTQDCIDAVEIYVDYCLDLMIFCGDVNCLVEGSFVHPQIKDLGGTADFACYDLDERRIEIVDYKNGTGEDVWAYENTQLMIYALLYYYELMKLYECLEVQVFRLTICQPRHRKHQDDGGLDSWDITLNELLTWEEEELIPAIVSIESGKAKGVYMPSDEACKWCEAWNACPAQKGIIDEFQVLLDEDEAEKLEEIEDPIALEARIKWVLDNEKLLKKYIKRATDYATDKCLDGEDYVNRKVTQGVANRSYKKEPTSDQILNQAIAGFKVTMARHDLMVPTCVLPPAQLEKKLKSFGVSKDDITNFMLGKKDENGKYPNSKTERLPGSQKLVLQSAKGDAITRESEWDLDE